MPVSEIDLIDPVCEITYRKLTWSSEPIVYREMPRKYKMDQTIYYQGDCTATFADPTTTETEALWWRDDWNESITCYEPNLPALVTDICPLSLAITVVDHPGTGYELDKAQRTVVIPGQMFATWSYSPGYWLTVPGQTYTEAGPPVVITPASRGRVVKKFKVVVR